VLRDIRNSSEYLIAPAFGVVQLLHYSVSIIP